MALPDKAGTVSREMATEIVRFVGAVASVAVRDGVSRGDFLAVAGFAFDQHRAEFDVSPWSLNIDDDPASGDGDDSRLMRRAITLGEFLSREYLIPAEHVVAVGAWA
jgi:hypothetical protein